MNKSTVMRAVVIIIALSLSLSLFPLAARGEDAVSEAPRVAEENTSGAAGALLQRITLTGTLEGDFAWAEHEDVTAKGSESVTDLFISTLELGIEAEFADWISGNVLFLDEDIGTEDETGIEVDEAMVSFQSEDFPVYLSFGKRVQPFGIYENHLVEDPMTQDAYEMNEVGLTVGFTGPAELDVSITAYKGNEQMDHLFESALFDADLVARPESDSNDVESYIVSASIMPFENGVGYLTLFGGFLSEPGGTDRNETVNIGASLVPPFLKNMRLDAEYMRAVSRELYEGLAREYKEGVLSLGLAYEFILREREVIGGGLFAERKAHKISEPLEFAVRYEHFDDDGLADDLGSWSVDKRYGLGARYTFHEEGVFAAYISAEYRMTDYKVHPGVAMDDKNDEAVVRLGVTF